jgi:antitoxin component of MazEF toxin-antitoxin module
MIKTIAKVGNSNGIIFDATLMDLAHLKRGDEVNVEVHEGGMITLSPLRRSIEPKMAAATAARLIGKNSELFRRLA